MAGIEINTSIEQTECYHYYFITELPKEGTWLVWKSSQAYSWIHFGQLRNRSSIYPEVDERVGFDLLLILCIIWLTLQHCLGSIPLNGEEILSLWLQDWLIMVLSTKICWINWSMCELYHLWAWMGVRQHLLQSRGRSVPSFPSALCSLIQTCLLYIFFFVSSIRQAIYRYVACFQWEQIFSCYSPQLSCKEIMGTEMSTLCFSADIQPAEVPLSQWNETVMVISRMKIFSL